MTIPKSHPDVPPQPVLRKVSMAVLQSLRDRTAGALHWLRLKEGLRALAPRPDDVFLVSYPKSGTTLMQMMLYQMTTPGDMDFPHISAVCPYFEYELGRGHMEFLRLPSPRIFKSHLLFKHLELSPDSRCIYIVRDVRDVALSAYHHEFLVTGRDPGLTEFLSRFLDGRTRFGSWFSHIESWWPHHGDGNVLCLRYEQVVADLAGTVRRVADFCGFEVRDEDMPRIVERCGLPFMKRYNEKFDPRLSRFSSGAPEFIRKGGGGGGEEVMNDAQRQQLMRELASLASRVNPSAGHPLGDLLRLKTAD